MTDYTIAVVKDALTVLDLVGESSKGLTLTEMTEASGLGKNKVFRILHTLQQSRMIYRDENGRFHLGIRISELAQNVHIHDLLLNAANPVMDELVKLTQETIFLGVISDMDALCIATRESPRSMGLYGQVGKLYPLHMGGVPKVLLANMSSLDCEKHLDYLKRTITKPFDWAGLRERLTQIRHQGYSITVDEYDEGAHSISAPIFDSKGSILAAMSIAGPSFRFSDEMIDTYIELIVDRTKRISEVLGYAVVREAVNGNIMT